MAADGDGTLWRGDIGDAFFLAALRDGALREAAHDPLLAEAEAQGVDVTGAGDANEVARRLFDAHRAGRYPEEPAFAMMAWAFAGWTVGELADHCRRVLDEFQFDEAVHDELRPVLAWASQRDIPFWLVTASPLAVATAAAKRLGIASERVVAMEPALAGDVVEPRLARRATYGDGKLARLKEATDAPLLAAFGDSGYDAAMLRAAEVPVAVFPNSELRALAPGLPGLVVLGDR